MLEKLKAAIEALAGRITSTTPPVEALQLSQAVFNLAQAVEYVTPEPGPDN